MSAERRIAFIGFGEAGGAFAEGWKEAPPGRLSAWDIKLDDPDAAATMRARMERLGVVAAPDAAAALDGAEIVLSLVTADRAVEAARSYAPHLAPGTLWCDLNSCSPGSKRIAADTVGRAGARYLDVAVMAPVYPLRNLVPCLLAGPEAVEVATTLAGLPMTVEVAGDRVGEASAIKMIRSVMVKGMEALTAECALAAERAGVADRVLASLEGGPNGIDLARRAAYNFERSLRHGARRAAEMEEVAATLEELGLPAPMSRATADWQRRLGGLVADIPDGDASWDEAAKAILAEIGR